MYTTRENFYKWTYRLMIVALSYDAAGLLTIIGLGGGSIAYLFFMGISKSNG